MVARDCCTVKTSAMCFCHSLSQYFLFAFGKLAMDYEQGHSMSNHWHTCATSSFLVCRGSVASLACIVTHVACASPQEHKVLLPGDYILGPFGCSTLHRMCCCTRQHFQISLQECKVLSPSFHHRPGASSRLPINVFDRMLGRFKLVCLLSIAGADRKPSDT